MKKKVLCAIVCAVVFLSACTTNDAPNMAPAPTVSPAAASLGNLQNRQGAEIVFAVSRDADDILINAARDFANGLEERTNGALTARVELSIAPDADLLTGDAQIALLSKRRQLEFCASLATSATPFLYNGFNNFLMRSNAGNVMSILEFSLRQDHGLIPLAAFYQGAQHLLIDFSPGGYQHFDSMTIITSEDEHVREFFGMLVGVGGNTIPFDTEEERMENFLCGTGNAVETSLQSLVDMQEEGFRHHVHLIVSYHDLVPVWLVANAEFIDRLPPAWKAEIAELRAYMANQINDAYRNADNEHLRILRYDVPNLTLVTQFTHVRNRLFNNLPPLGEEADERQALGRDLLNIMRRTA